MIAKQILSDLTNFDFSDVLYNICITDGVNTDENLYSSLNIGNRIFSNLAYCDTSLYNNTSIGTLYPCAILHGGIIKDNDKYFTDPAYYLILVDEYIIAGIKKCWLTDNTWSQMGKDETIGVPIQSVFSADTMITIDSGVSALHISVGGLDFESLYEEPPTYYDDQDSLWTQGRNQYGQLGLNDAGVDRSSPTQIGNNIGYSSIACGFGTSFAIKNDSLYSQGQNYHGQLGQGDSYNGHRSSPTQIGSDSNQITVTSGYRHSFAFKNDGSLQGWGYNGQYNLGLSNNNISRSSPTQIGSDVDWSMIACGYDFSLGLKTNGTLQTWGYNDTGLLGQNNTLRRSSPIQVGISTDQNLIACGHFHSLAIKDNGSLQTWGDNNNGELGLSGFYSQSLETTVDVISSSNYNLAYIENNSLYMQGINYHGSLGLNNIVAKSSPAQVGALTDQNTVSCGEFHTLAIKTNGSLQAQGYNNYGTLGLNNRTYRSSPVQVGASLDWSKVACFHSHSVALKTDGTLQTWGDAMYGELGGNDRIRKSSPVQVGSDTNQESISCGNKHTLAVKTTGSLQSQGNNYYGQLGSNNRIAKSSPTQIGSDTDWGLIACGYSHSLAIKTDGTLQSWGMNTYGFLGLNDTVQRSSPTQVGNSTTQIKIRAGKNYNVAIQSDGSLYSQGYNTSGILGLNSQVNSPLQIGSVSDQTDAAFGFSKLIGVNTDDTLYNISYPTIGNKSSPTQIGSENNQVSINCGKYNSLAIKDDGSLQAQGKNNLGQLGVNDTEYRSSPIQVGNDTDWSLIGAGYEISLAIKTNGTLQSWGYNYQGVGGFNDDILRSSPTQIGLLNTWSKVSIFESSTLATIKSPIPLILESIDLGINDKKSIKNDMYTFNPISGYYTAITESVNLTPKFGHGICVLNNDFIMQIGGGADQTVVNFLDCSCSKTDFTSIKQFGNPGNVEIIDSNTGDTTQFGGGILEEQLTGKPSGQDFGDDTIAGEDGLYLKVEYPVLSNLALDLTNQFAAKCVVHLPDETTTIFDDSLTPPFYMDFTTDSTNVCVWSKQPKGTRIKQVLTFISQTPLFMQGDNNNGCLGIGESGQGTDRSSPVQVGNGINWKSVSCGLSTTVATKKDGTLQAWGDNYYGQLGQGYRGGSAASPIQVGALTDWSIAYMGDNSIGVIKTDGSLQVWGANDWGVLGLGHNDYQSSPTQVGELTDQKDLALGRIVMSAIKDDGSLWAQGSNYHGDVGNGTTVDQYSPIQIGFSTNQTKIARCSVGTGFAIKNNGTLWGQGNNYYGQLCKNDLTHRSSPVQIGVDTDQSLISCGYQHVIALKTTGSLQSWGIGDKGQLGHVDSVSRSGPVQIGDGVDWAKIQCSKNASYAIKSDGSLQSWGYNYKGQLGLGDNIDRSSPSQVGTDQYFDILSNANYTDHIGAINNI